MFQMNTRLKQTPFPVPSFSFLTKNFNDGTHEIDDKSIIIPSFGSLGLQDDFEAEPIDESLKEFRSDENQEQKVRILIIYL